MKKYTKHISDNDFR